MALTIEKCARLGLAMMAAGSLAALGACGGDAPEADAGDAAAPAGEAPAVARDLDGREIFHGSGTCFSCHGQDGVGTPIGPALNDAVWLHFEERPTPEAVIELVKTGVDQPIEYQSPMLPMAGVRLTDAELDAVATYVLSLTGEATDEAMEDAADA